MTIARESATQVTSTNQSVNNTAGTLLVFVANTNGTLASLTYGGDACTKAITTGSVNQQIWYLVNPKTGSNSLVGTSLSYDAGYVMFYTGATISNDTFVGNSSVATTSITSNITVGASTYWVIAGVRSSVGSGQTNNGGVAGHNLVPSTEDDAWDSNGTVASGSQVVSYSNSSSNWQLAAITIAPVATIPATNFLIMFS